MSFPRKRDTELTISYDHSLEQQIMKRGTSLPCGDDELWKQVEGRLQDGNAQEVHCLGLDPLTVMEESLKAAVTADFSRRVRSRGGLEGLAKAFEVLEQAALNLYLGPWRKEYKVIQMYSGRFTHYITPVLSMRQIENLFGLLGYQPNAPSSEQLHLQSHRLGPASSDDLLRLSCAFFLARCECRLLTAALGKHSSDTRWELSVVMERQRGSSLQVAMDNTAKMLEVREPQTELTEEVDLYGDEQDNGGERQLIATDDESPRSISWGPQSGALPPSVKRQSNGVTSPSSPHEPVTRSASASSKRPSRHRYEERPDKTSSQPRSLQAELMEVSRSEHAAAKKCSCVHAAQLHLERCVECNVLHGRNCPSLSACMGDGHSVEGVKESGGGNAAVCSLALQGDPKSIASPPHAIAYHTCCDLTKLDPHLLCHDCILFHSASCAEAKCCSLDHDTRQLRECSTCSKHCLRKPLVLCRYCGNEYCNECWYRNPVTCSCGQTFDQSSSV